MTSSETILDNPESNPEFWIVQNRIRLEQKLYPKIL